MNRQEFISYIEAQNGCKVVTIHTRTVEKMLKSWHGPIIYKKSIVNGMINFYYENSVNRQRMREDNGEAFVAKQPAWGTYIEKEGGKCAALLTHNDETYMSIKIERRQDSYELANGSPIEEKEFYEYKSNKSAIEKASACQGLEKPVIIRKFNINNIMSININGSQITISDEE